ncbi:MAG: FecR family protein [Blastocatellia bacterium]
MNSRARRGSRLRIPRWLLALIGFLAAAQTMSAVVYAQLVEARIKSVGGYALRINSLRAFTLAKGDTLAPGDEIDTSRGGRVVIELTDGSVVIVQPGSRLVFKDYRAASSLRELFQILVGRVRVKINHYGGRPNPYRVNSPTASILVRGTEFGVAVERTGETRVVVYEGLVEVESLSDPRHRALVSPGRGVLVRPNADIRFFTPGPGSEIGERSGSGNGSQRLMQYDANSFGGLGMDIRNYVANDYERYIDSLVEPGESPPFLRFTAFPDSYFDSLENPAYATEFNAVEGRMWLIPSFSNLRGNPASEPDFDHDSLKPTDFGLLLQGAFFVPWSEARTVFGGAAAVSDSRLQSFSTAKVFGPPTPFFPSGIPGVRTTASATETDSITGSLMAARRFGQDGRTSVGIGVDYVSGDGSLRGVTSLSALIGLKADERLEAVSQVERLRLRVGLSHEFKSGHKLGLFYRRGLASAEDRDRSRTFNGLALTLDSVSYEGQTSEIGLRLRGPITRRLFYGVESSWLTVKLNENIQRAAIVDTTERERITRAAFSFGLGYALRKRTALSADVATGFSRVKEEYYEDATGNLTGDERKRNRFFSAQIGAQTDIWRELFVSASLFSVTQTRLTDLKLYPDRFGRRLTSFGESAPDGRTQKSFTENYSDFGVGWRFKPNLLAEYVYSTGHAAAPRHVFLLRYTFKFER